MLLNVQPVTTQMAVIFKAGEARLGGNEAEVLKSWVMDWSARSGRHLVALGGACETSRTGRLRRLNSLLEMFEQFGVPSKNIKQDEDWSRPSRMGSMDDLPADVVWLELIEPQGHRSGPCRGSAMLGETASGEKKDPAQRYS